jgi:hypothetical protein
LIDHPAEQPVIFAVQAQIDKAFAELFDPNYAALLNGARERVAPNAERSR